MTTPDIQKNSRIREDVSKIFNSAKSAKNGDSPEAVSDLARSSIDERFEKGSDDHSLAMFFLDQIDQRSKPVNPASSESESDQFEFWTFVHDDEKLGNKIKLIRLLDRGATSEVWLAESRQSRRSIAIKLVNSEGFSEKIRVSLVIEELQNLFRVTHPNIVEIYSAGKLRNQNGVEAPFVIMEYIEGEPLDKWVANRAMPLTLREAVSIVVIIARALQFLHEGAPKLGISLQLLEPIYHTDLKPPNIMMTSAGPKLIDFGSLVHSPSLGHIGTRAYLAPQRILSGATPNAQWDLFSLGGVLYFLVAGSHPLDTDRATLTESDWNYWIGSVNLGNDDLNRIFRKCMAYNAADGYESASDLAEDFEAWLANRPLPHVRQNDYTWWQREKLLWKRSRERNDVYDHSQIVARAMLVIALITGFNGLVNPLLVMAGFQPEIAMQIVNTPAVAIGALLCAVVMYAIRFQVRSVLILEPLFATAISFFCLLHFAIPRNYMSIPNWQEANIAGLVALIIVGIVNISFASLAPEWKVIRPVGWTILATTFFLRPLFESRVSSFAMPIVVSTVEVILCLIYASRLWYAPKDLIPRE